MKRRNITFCIILLALLLLAGCAGGPPPQPLAFAAAPWSDSESSTYDVLGKDGRPAGSASWTWHATRWESSGWYVNRWTWPGCSKRLQ